MPRDTKEFEKARLKGEPGLKRWLTTMPLSPGGIDRNALYLRDFALMLSNLGCPPGSRVLEIGAGSCWASEWLGRLGYRAVASDINEDMVRIGQERLEVQHRALPEIPLPTRLVSADGEALPFKDEVFDAVFCLQSLHHIPHVSSAIAQAFRALKKGGRFICVEPGEGHSLSAASQREMEELGVLEQDILIDEIHSIVQAAGFAELYLCPAFDLQTRLPIEDWRKLGSQWRGLRPARKWGLALSRSVRFHPAIVCVKPGGHADRILRPTGLIVAVRAPSVVRRREVFDIEARVKNTGNDAWLSYPGYLAGNPLNQGEGGFVALGFKLRRQDGSYYSRDYGRGQLAEDLQPSAEASIRTFLKAPEEPGSYSLKIDLVQEGIGWFQDWGSTPAICDLYVSPELPPAVPNSYFPHALRAEFKLERFDAESGSVVLLVKNTGDTTWLKDPPEWHQETNRFGAVNLGVQILGTGQDVVDLDFQRIQLPKNVEPEEELRLSFNLDEPNCPPGAAFLKFDMVDEGIAWFEWRGSTPLVVPLT